MNNKVEILLIMQGNIIDRKEIEYNNWELINLVDYFDLDHVQEFINDHGEEVVQRLKNIFGIAQ